MNLIPIPLTSFRVDADTGVIYDTDGNVYTGDNVTTPASSPPVTIPAPPPSTISSGGSGGSSSAGPFSFLSSSVSVAGVGVPMWILLAGGALALGALAPKRRRR